MRVEIHVRPNASSTAVGGAYDKALVVRVVEAAEGGRATVAALGAVARALGIPNRSVTLVRGASSRRKLIDIDVGDAEGESMAASLARLRSGAGR